MVNKLKVSSNFALYSGENEHHVQMLLLIWQIMSTIFFSLNKIVKVVI